MLEVKPEYYISQPCIPRSVILVLPILELMFKQTWKQTGKQANQKSETRLTAPLSVRVGEGK